MPRSSLFHQARLKHTVSAGRGWGLPASAPRCRVQSSPPQTGRPQVSETSAQLREHTLD